MDNEDPHRRQALEALRQAAASIEAASQVRVRATLPVPGMAPQAFEQRKALMELAAKVIDSDTDRLMDIAVGNWTIYKESQSG